MSAASTRLPPAEDLGSVSQAPHFPEGFNDTFTGRYIDDTGEVRLHAVIGGVGHWVAEEAPEELLTALTEFLAPYRDGEAAAQDSRKERAYLRQPATQVPQPERRGQLDPTKKRRSL